MINKTDSGNSTSFQERLQRAQNVFLAVDDDNLIRRLAAKILGQHGIVIEVADGSNVMDKYVEHNPDMVLLDIHMPGKSGLDVIDDIMDFDRDAFVVMCSADSVADNVTTAMQKGAVGFISKPLKKDKINDYLNRCITIKD
jgi:two-component system chemotaxis response regulator CheY